MKEKADHHALMVIEESDTNQLFIQHHFYSLNKEKVMKKIFTMAVIAIVAVATSAEHTTENAHEVVYHVSGSSYYHKSADNAKAHIILDCVNDDDCKIYMQLRKGCDNAQMHKCVLCYGLNK